MDTKDHQVKHVVQGVALGVLAQDVDGVTSGKSDVEFAFNRAWRLWDRTTEFPAITGIAAGNLFWLGVRRSANRKGVYAAWDTSGPWLTPYRVIEGWDIDDCLDELADDRASASDWIDFGRLYVAEFKPEHLLHKAE